MCGLVGIVHRDPASPVEAGPIRTMCGAIRHRGPDDEGMFVSGQVGLGMRRLSIIDLDGGRQPIANEDGSKVIVFNGEIYNYRDLRRELVARGHRVRTASDTETIVHLYEDAGPAAVERLRGMFALAIWDGEARSLFLARDRFGIKPLYYVTAPWGLAFASELKALVAAGLTARELDWEALDTYFQLGYIPAPASPFRDVRKVPPGHWLLWRPNGEILVHQYWDLPRRAAPAPPEPERHVLEWLDESVAAHLISDVPVAAFLSGGLDSSAVVASMALAARDSGGGAVPQAFTARYSGSGAAAADETGLARSLADRYGVRLNVVDISPDVRDTFEPIVRALDEPHADDSAIPTWAISEAVGSSHKVALTGIGGDELFAGYRRHLGLGMAERYARLPRGLRRIASRVAQLVPDAAGRGLTVDRLKRFLRAGDGGSAERYLDLLSRADETVRFPLYSAGLRGTIVGDGARTLFRQLHRDGPARHDPLTTALYFDYRTYLPDDILALSDRLSMAHSLEIRVPFVDHALVERVFPLPSRLKVGDGEYKRLLRRALAGRLPAEHFRAPKRGFVGPTAAWLRNELRPLVEDELSPGRTRRLGLFDAQALTRLCADHFSRRHNREGVLWALLCFSTWHRLYLEQPPAAPYRPARVQRGPVSAMVSGSPGGGS